MSNQNRIFMLSVVILPTDIHVLKIPDLHVNSFLHLSHEALSYSWTACKCF